jgi:hypothetical protein
MLISSSFAAARGATLERRSQAIEQVRETKPSFEGEPAKLELSASSHEAKAYIPSRDTVAASVRTQATASAIALTAEAQAQAND